MTEEKPIHVLLVDDETDFTEPIAFWLKSRGYGVESAVNGEEALRMIQGNRPDIVFLDINMPVLDGLEALRRLRGFDKDLPVIMVTAAFSSEDKITRAKELGVSGFFAKNYLAHAPRPATRQGGGVAADRLKRPPCPVTRFPRERKRQTGPPDTGLASKSVPAAEDRPGAQDASGDPGGDGPLGAVHGRARQ